MKLVDRFKNTFLYQDKYKTDSEAIIIACYFNPQKNPYRLKAFQIWYESIKHLNHHIVECVIGDTTPELTDEVQPENRKTIYTENLLWHKETLLNNIIANLPKQFKYIFWLDTDVIFSNKNWLVDGVKQLQTKNLVQPFAYCIHLEQDQTEPHFDVTHEYEFVTNPKTRHPKMWKSFGANHVAGNSCNTNYDSHGHVGFAWGARREVLDAVPLYDRALIGGADHIIAHAGAGQIGHSCITKSFTDDIDAVNEWSLKFYNAVQGKIGYVQGDLYHIWHGDVAKRQYLKRIQDFTPETKKITKKDKNGLYITDDDTYVKKYFDQREVKAAKKVAAHSTYGNFSESESRNQLRQQYPDRDDSFIDSLMWGYITDSSIMGTAMGGNMLGAIIGDALNDNDKPVEGGVMGFVGEFSDTPQSDSTQVDNVDYSQSENFS
jgi:hypothetical protein